MPHIAHIHWNEAGEPISKEHDDVYFSAASGIEESRYVFLQHNQLPERFAQLQAGASLTIGETGFGTGLNFLTTWEAFERHADPDASLHFISVEYAPLSRHDLKKSLAIWAPLAPYRDALIEQYHAIHEGFQTLLFDEGRIKLTLLIGEISEILPQLNATIDAWYLDGFAPAKNPEMWNRELFETMATLSTPETTLATFTAAGFVRRGLIAAGFSMKKTEGFGTKREMIYGKYIGKMGPFPRYALPRHPNWFKRAPTPWIDQEGRLTTNPIPSALVIGAGIAGISTANALARRGWQVTLAERHDTFAQEGSGNPQGVLYLKLSAHRTDQTRLLLEGYGYTLRLLHQLTREGKLRKGEDWDDCGVLQLANGERRRQRQDALTKRFPSTLLHAVDRAEASHIANRSLNEGGLFYPEGGWVAPRQLCKALLDHPNITLIPHCSIDSLHYQPEKKSWKIGANQALENHNIVVLANATEAKAFPFTQALPLKNIRGQITLLPEPNQAPKIQSVICGEGYLSPAKNGEYCIGATFNFDHNSLTLDPEDHAENIAMLAAISPELTEQLNLPSLDLTELKGRAAYRSTANDKMPLIGPIADHQPFMERFAQITKDARALPDEEVPWIPALYLNVAHGSRGMITAPIAGEQLAAIINNEPYILEEDLMEACHPNRCWYRQLRFPEQS